MKICVLRGGSMRPLVKPGAILLVESARLEQLYVGAMVVFGNHDGRLIAHRVVSVKHFPDRLCVRTRGDSAETVDPCLVPEQLVGRVVAFWQQGRLRKTGPVRDRAALIGVELWRLVRRSAWVRRWGHWVGAWVMRKRPALKQGVVFRQEGDEALVFDPHSGEVALLNETGRVVWEMLAAGADTSVIARRLSEEFEVPDQTALIRDIERFVTELRSAGMIGETENSTEAGPLSRG